MNIPTDAADMPAAVPAKKNTKKVPRSSSSMSSMVDEDQPPKKKQKNDPDVPKRANTAYMIYSKENRESVQDANPGITLGDTVSVQLNLFNFYMIVRLTYCKIRYSPWSCLSGSRR